jgi:hypothetical protein
MRFSPTRWALIGLSCACPALALPGDPHPACVPTEEVAAILGQHYEGGAEERAPAILEALASHADDVHLHRAYQDSAWGEEVVERYRARAAEHPHNPSALYLYGRVLARDEKAQSHLSAAIDACPNSPIILRRLGDLPEAEIAERAALARAWLAESPGPAIAVLIQAVWAAEFKTLPPGEHGAVRERIRGDLVLLRGSQSVDDRMVLEALREGYAQDGYDVGFDWAIQETARRFPDDEMAKRAAFTRFHEVHSLTDPCDVEASRIYHRELAETGQRWIELWPRAPEAWLARLQGVAGSPDPTAENITAAVDGLLETTSARPSAVPGTPLAFRGAEALVQQGLALDRVPALIDQGMAEIRARAAEGELSPGETERAAAGLATLVNARLLLDQVEPAREAFDELQRTVHIDAGSREPTPEQEAAWRRGLAIEQVVRHQPVGPLVCGTDEPAASLDSMERLDPELARTVAEFRGWASQPLPVSESFGEAKSFALPEFELQDMSGQTWRTSDLLGKVVLFHAWARQPTRAWSRRWFGTAASRSRWSSPRTWSWSSTRGWFRSRARGLSTGRAWCAIRNAASAATRRAGSPRCSERWRNSRRSRRPGPEVSRTSSVAARVRVEGAIRVQRP